MLPRPYDDDDSLQTWLAGQPAWPLAHAREDEDDRTLAVRVVGDECLLRGAVRDRADELLALQRRGDRRADRVRLELDALRGELRS